MEMLRKCRTCGKDLSIDKTGDYCNIQCFNSRERNIFEEKCEICQSKYVYKVRRKNQWCQSCIQYGRQIKHFYGITLLQYIDILTKQNGCCAVCKINKAGYKGKRLSVDHNHKTNEVRGLLCDDCNNAIGKLKDDMILAKNALDYSIDSEYYPLSMKDAGWDKYFLDIAELVAVKSKDPSTKVGAVIVDENNIIRGMGYNGFPRGVEYDDKSRLERPKKYFFMVHAEANAIVHTGRNMATGCTLYSSCIPRENGGGLPCCECTKLIIQAGIIEVVCRYNPNIHNVQHSDNWRQSLQYSKEMLKEAGVKLRYINE
jgi:dCMP deaminase